MTQDLPSSLTITLQFEELALFAQSTITDRYYTAMIDGKFEVSAPWNDPSDWHISDIWIIADNGRCGNQCRVNHVNLNADTEERFYLLVLDALTTRYSDRIEEMIEAECAENGVAADAA